MSNCDRRLSDAAREAARLEVDKLSGGGIEPELCPRIDFLHDDAEEDSEYALDNATADTAALPFGAEEQGKYPNLFDEFGRDFSSLDGLRSQTMSKDLPHDRKDIVQMQQKLTPLAELDPIITGNMSLQTLLPTDAPASPHEACVQSINAEPQALRQPCYSLAGAQAIAPYKDAEVSIFMTVVPSLNYTYEACMNRIRKLQYDPVVQLSHEKKRQEHTVTMRQLQLELDVAISNYLQTTLQLSQPTRRQLVHFYVALFYGVILELVNVARLQNKPPNPPQHPFQLRDHQVRCLLRALNEMNSRLRDVKDCEKGAFFACAERTAWAWQVDIYRYWIKHFTGQKKRKEEPREEALELSHAHERIKSDLEHPSNTDNVPKRRPGRPPGALNKSTVAAREKKAAAVAARARASPTSSPALPTPSPRAPTRPLQITSQGQHLFLCRAVTTMNADRGRYLI